MIEMPANEFRFVTVGFFFDTVIKDENRVRPLDLANQWFDNFPEVFVVELLACQKSCDLIVAQLRHESGHACRTSLSKGDD